MSVLFISWTRTNYFKNLKNFQFHVKYANELRIKLCHSISNVPWKNGNFALRKTRNFHSLLCQILHFHKMEEKPTTTKNNNLIMSKSQIVFFRGGSVKLYPFVPSQPFIPLQHIFVFHAMCQRASNVPHIVERARSQAKPTCAAIWCGRCHWKCQLIRKCALFEHLSQLFRWIYLKMWFHAELGIRAVE